MPLLQIMTVLSSNTVKLILHDRQCSLNVIWANWPVLLIVLFCPLLKLKTAAKALNLYAYLERLCQTDSYSVSHPGKYRGLVSLKMKRKQKLILQNGKVWSNSVQKQLSSQVDYVAQIKKGT